MAFVRAADDTLLRFLPVRFFLAARFFPARFFLARLAITWLGSFLGLVISLGWFLIDHGYNRERRETGDDEDAKHSVSVFLGFPGQINVHSRNDEVRH